MTSPLPLIRVFKGEWSDFWIKKFDVLGVFCPVDSVHDLDWLKKECAEHPFAFGIDQYCKASHVKELITMPELLFCCLENDDVDVLIQNIIAEDPKMTEYFLKGFITERKEYQVENLISMAPEVPDIKDPYSFRCKLLDSYDVKLYEVIRPGTSTPFTVLIDNFSRKSDEYFFTDIYGCNAWDFNRRECRFDFLFLQSLWKHVGLEGDFNMNILKKRVDRCYPGVGTIAEAEPIVYRNTMENVEDIVIRQRVPRK